MEADVRYKHFWRPVQGRQVAAGKGRRRPTKVPRVAGAAVSLAPTAVKLEKTDLNADYMDDTGLVRLSSVD